MSLKQILDIITKDSGSYIFIIIIVLSLIQISPLKIDPWSFIARNVGKIIHKPVLDKIDDIEDKIDNIETKVNSVEKDLSLHVEESNMQNLQTIRAGILSFGSYIMHGENFHKERFDFMIRECDDYEKYCEENNVKDGVAEATISEIKRVYQIRLKENSFLKEGEKIIIRDINDNDNK